MSVDRISGIGLAVFAVLVLEETWRQRLPLGSVGNPGPAYFPGLLAVLLLAAGLAVAALGGAGPRAASLDWREWRHGVAIFAACAFCALALERLGYRLTIFVALGFLVGVVERKSPAATLVFAAALALGTFWLFDTLLRVPLPRGSLGF
jgi:putative tricarboxylic transport membrane protein